MGKNNTYWLVNYGNSSHLSVEDPGGWFSATIDRGGCVNLKRYFNVPLGGGDTDL